MIVEDSTGSRGLLLDLRMQNVGVQNHTVNFTGYAVDNGNDTWFHNRSIDNSSLTYNIEKRGESFRVEFETVDYWRYWDWD